MHIDRGVMHLDLAARDSRHVQEIIDQMRFQLYVSPDGGDFFAKLWQQVFVFGQVTRRD